MSPAASNDPKAANRPPRDKPAGSDQKLMYLLVVTGMSLMILVLLYIILETLAGILQPLFVAIFICYLIVPAHRRLVARGIPSIIAYVIVLGGFLTVIFSAGGMAYQGVKALSVELPAHIEHIRTTTDEINARVREAMTRLLPESIAHPLVADDEESDAEEDSEEPEEGGVASTDGVEEPSRPVERAVPPIAEQPAANTMGRWISNQRLVEWGQSLLNPLFGFATTALVVVFYLIFLLAEVAGIRRRLVNAFGAVQAQRILQVANSINTAISHYIMVKTFVSLLVAVLSTGILLAFDVRYAIIWGILTFFANYIPYVGSLVAVILPVLMTFALAGPSGTLLLMLVLLVGTQVLVGSFLEPRMIGRKLGISPLIILLGLAFWGMLWGIPGMVLSSPLLVTAKIILENMEPTRPLARLMSNV